MVISQILPDLAQICLPTPKSRLVASCGPFRLLHTTLVQICPQRNPNTATTTFFWGGLWPLFAGPRSDSTLWTQVPMPWWTRGWFNRFETLTRSMHIIRQYHKNVCISIYAVCTYTQCICIHISYITYTIYICVLFHQQMACWTWLSMIIFYQGWSVTRCAKEMILKLFAFGCTGFFLGTDRACLGGHGWTVAGGWRRWPFMKTTGECSGLVGFIFYLWKHPEDLCKVVR